MRAGHTLAAAAAAIALASAPAAAADGILIAQKTTNGTTTTTTQTQIEKTRMRTEIDQNGKKMIMIFDGAGGGVMRMIDEQAKSYTEITKADVDRLSQQMSGAMAQLQQQMQNLPPEQRARMEQMMAGRSAAMGAIAGPPTSYTKIGTDTVGKWKCDKYEGTKNGQKSSEVCTVDPSVAGFAVGDFEVTKQMAEFFSKMMPQGMDSMFRIGSAGASNPNAFSGVPVRMVTFKNGAAQSTMELTDMSRQNFPDSLFAVPAGYAKKDMAGMRGRQ